VYRFAPAGSDAWWTRDQEQEWLAPTAIDTPGLQTFLADYGWPSPTAE
jgi:hypothetical protein